MPFAIGSPYRDNPPVTAAPIDRSPLPGSVLEGYRSRRRSHPELTGPDELLDADGDVRAGWADLAAAVELLGTAGLTARVSQVRRLLQDAGVTYAPGDAEDLKTLAGSWRLDPLPTILSGPEWDVICAGVTQRARLLDLLLADIYGPRRLIAAGVLPPELVYGHAGFLRQCDGVLLPGDHQLIVTATDVVRQGDGWAALGDRSQAPSGSGYAMQNRRVVSRVMPGLYRDTQLRRLRSFFHAIRAAVHGVAPRGAKNPRAVILTPGAPSETSFEHAFLSTLLGFPLVEGRDLQVRDEQVWFRSLGRPERVDVVLRRVDGWFCDPLELKPDSRLGVPGLLQAARAGNVAIVNPPGAGVLENGGLTAFLPQLARHLLGEELRLPSVQTWWCGDPASRAHVLARLPELVVRPIARGVGRANRFGWELPAARLEELRARIEAEPHAWCAQERLEMSSTPVAVGEGLEPRRLVLRAFAVAAGDGYELMNGGLGRVGAEVDTLDVSNQSGALAKDIWVLAGDPEAATATFDPPTLVPPPGQSQTQTQTQSQSPTPGRVVRARTSVEGPEVEETGVPGGLPAVPGLEPGTRLPTSPTTVPAYSGPVAPALPARVAEDLFWLGRYAERAEGAARLLRVASDLAADHASAPGSAGARGMAAMLRAVTGTFSAYPGFIGEGAPALLAAPHGELLRLAVDEYRPGTLAHALRHTVEAAYGVRELLSTDTFLVLGGMERALLELAQRTDEPELHLQPAMSRLLEGLLALAGLAAESMVRDGGWYVMDAGRRLERSIQLVQMLRYALSAPPAPGGMPPETEELVLESVLIAAESVITMRRRAPGRPRAEAVLQLLLIDPGNPRGLRYQLDRLIADLQRLDPGAAPLPELVAVLSLLDAGLPAPDPRAPLLAVLDRLAKALPQLATAVASTYFARVLLPQPLAVPGDEPR